MNAITPFDFEGHAVRVIHDEAGLPWFVARDVCEALGLAKHDTAVERLDHDEKGSHTMGTLGGDQSLTTVNEAGLYRLILTSRKPEARRFSRWVTHDVLPALRKHGHYTIAGAHDIASRADVLVSAGRIFNACFRVARRIGMERLRAQDEALAATARETGVDWANIISIDRGIDTLPAESQPRPDSEVALFLQQWKEGELGLEYRPTLTTELFASYRAWCSNTGATLLNLPRFSHAIKRQWGRCCQARRRWRDADGNIKGPHGFIDPPGAVVVEALRADLDAQSVRVPYPEALPRKNKRGLN